MTMSIHAARQILRQLPLGTSLAVCRELDARRPLEAHRLLTTALGDGRTAKSTVAALIRWRLTGR